MGGTSLATAALAGARQLLPGVDAQLEAWGVALSAAVILTVACGYAVAMRMAARA
jgi:hypothetical protein